MHALGPVWWVIPTTLLIESAGSHTHLLAKVFAAGTHAQLFTARMNKIFAVPTVYLCHTADVT